MPDMISRIMNAATGGVRSPGGRRQADGSTTTGMPIARQDPVQLRAQLQSEELACAYGDDEACMRADGLRLEIQRLESGQQEQGQMSGASTGGITSVPDPGRERFPTYGYTVVGGGGSGRPVSGLGPRRRGAPTWGSDPS
jgi:hypothetical protein